MKNNTLNADGLNLIQHFESLVLNAYQDSVGVWTIGWGHTGTDVTEGKIITEEEAESLLQEDLIKFEKAVNDLVSIELNENQFAALVSFAFNLGIGNLQSSTLLKLVNSNDSFNASKEFVKWSKAGGQRLSGLVKRRLSERNLFCSFLEPIVTTVPDDWETNYMNI
ncbi:MAG: lysozyme [Arcobacteraceae bacterium]